MPRQLRIQYEGAVYHLMTHPVQPPVVVGKRRICPNRLECLAKTCHRVCPAETIGWDALTDKMKSPTPLIITPDWGF
jgi:hypothetical protein